MPNVARLAAGRSRVNRFGGVAAVPLLRATDQHDPATHERIEADSIAKAGGSPLEQWACLE
jgi:hypothetical protein